MGVVFDTFRNTENIQAHRDVTVLVNDGEKTWGMMTADVQVRERVCVCLWDRESVCVCEREGDRECV